jgi:GNAT superfamily N-acetyltransferase
MIANPDLKEGDLVPVPCRHCASVALSIQITPSVLQIPCAKCGKASEVRIHNGMDGWAISVKAVSGESEESEEMLERPGASACAASFNPKSEASPGDTSESIIRLALAADAPAIARVHVDSWRTTYRDIVPEEHLAKLSYEKREELWNRVITDPRQFTFVAEAVGRIVGFASGGRNRGGEADYLGELYAVYLLQAQQQRGLGRRLTLGVARELEKVGMPTMLVWVLRETPACEFYLKLGGKAVASKLTIIGDKTLEEVAYGWTDLPALLLSA